MLVLSRKKNERIVLGGELCYGGVRVDLVVVEIRGDKVRIGIEAPKDLPVHRREVFDAIRRQQNGGQPDA